MSVQHCVMTTPASDAMRCYCPMLGNEFALEIAKSADDPDGQIRLQAAFSLGEFKSA